MTKQYLTSFCISFTASFLAVAALITLFDWYETGRRS